jgi:hypothetical protein
MKPLRNKFGIREVVEDIYEEGLTPYNKNEWIRVMGLFFEHLRESMLDPEVTDITLKNFATIRVKPITSIKEAKGFCTLFSMGLMEEKDIEVIMIKLSNILKQNHGKKRVAGVFSEAFPHFDQSLRDTSFWADLRGSFGVPQGGHRSSDGSATADANGSSDCANGERS